MAIDWDKVRKTYMLAAANGWQQGGMSLRISVEDFTKCSGDIQTLTTTVTGGTVPYTYSWSPSTGLSSTTSANPTASHTSTVTYTVIVTDANGRTATDTSVVTVPTAISATISSTTNVLCYGNSTGAATVVASNGTTPYTYLWDNGVTTAAITGLTAGVYGVTVSDACSNTARTFAYVTQPAAAVSISFVSDNNLCYGAAAGAATASATGGTGSYSYSWSNGSSNARITGLTAGTYVVTVTDGNSCSKTASVTITEPANYTITSTITGASSVVTGATAGLSASAVNATGTLTWAWTPTASIVSGTSTGTPVVGPTQATTYQVIVTDGCGKTASAQHAMTVTSGEEGFWTMTSTGYNIQTQGATSSGATAWNSAFYVDQAPGLPDSDGMVYLTDYGTGKGRMLYICANQTGGNHEFQYSDDMGVSFTTVQAPSNTYGGYTLIYGKPSGATSGVVIAWTYVAGGSLQPGIHRSDDGGITWTTPTADNASATQYGGQAIVWSGATFAVSGYTNRIWTATASGQNWTARTSPNTNETSSGCYGDGTFLFVQDTGTNRVTTSQDGITWTARTPTTDANPWVGVCYSPKYNRFVAIAYSGTDRVMYSDNRGVNWTAVNVPAEFWVKVEWSPKYEIFIAVANNTTTEMWSSDGITWNTYTSPLSGDGKRIFWCSTNDL